MWVYKLTNKINGKIYIGKTTKTIEARWKRHVYKATTETKGRLNTRLSCAIRKYGPKNFTFTEIDRATTEEELSMKEKYWIKKEDCCNPSIGYNLTDDSVGGNTYKYKTEEELSKIKEKLSACMLGEKNHRSKKVRMYNKETGEESVYGSLRELVRTTKLFKSHKSISSIIRENNGVKGNLVFSYV